MATFLKLNDLIQHMTQNQHIDSELERQAHEFLKRVPTLMHGESRFTATEWQPPPTETTVTDGSESKYKEIIG